MAIDFSRIDGIVFDLDGTLVDTFPDLTTAVNMVRNVRGLPPITVDEVKRHVGLGVSHLIDGAVPVSDVTERDRAVREFLDAYDDHLVEATRPYPGTEDGLTAFLPRPMAVLSNKPGVQTRAIVNQLGLARFFGAVHGGDDFVRLKPDPEPLLQTLAEIKVHPSRALMVGDSAVDVHTARAAGVAVALVTTGLATPEERRSLQPDLLVEDILALSREA